MNLSEQEFLDPRDGAARPRSGRGCPSHQQGTRAPQPLRGGVDLIGSSVRWSKPAEQSHPAAAPAASTSAYGSTSDSPCTMNSAAAVMTERSTTLDQAQNGPHLPHGGQRVARMWPGAQRDKAAITRVKARRVPLAPARRSAPRGWRLWPECATPATPRVEARKGVSARPRQQGREAQIEPKAAMNTSRGSSPYVVSTSAEVSNAR